jgi:hypothetical protein
MRDSRNGTLILGSFAQILGSFVRILRSFAGVWDSFAVFRWAMARRQFFKTIKLALMFALSRCCALDICCVSKFLSLPAKSTSLSV